MDYKIPQGPLFFKTRRKRELVSQWSLRHPTGLFGGPYRNIARVPNAIKINYKIEYETVLLSTTYKNNSSLSRAHDHFFY